MTQTAEPSDQSTDHRMGLGPTTPPSDSRTTSVAVALSLLLHIPAVMMLALVEPEDEPLPTTEFDANSQLTVDMIEESEEKEEKKPAEELQMVSLDQPEKEETPDEARFADQYEQKADKEQVNKALPGAPAPKPTPERPQRQPAPAPKPKPVDDEESTESEPEDEADLADVKREEDSTAEEESETPVQLEREQKGESASKKPAPEELFPRVSEAKALESVGEGGSVDYLRDVAEGDKTLLNRKRSRYWAFFDRVKVQVSQEWSPVQKYRKRDPYGKVYGVKDRYSAVDVTLNGDGTVRQLYLSRGSGLDFFDDEAVRAIRSAAPFHNPPEGLKDEDGLVHFTFGFFFEINASSGRLIRIFN